MKTGSFYVTTLRANAKTKDLAGFADRVGSCLEVDYGNRAFLRDGIVGPLEVNSEQSYALRGTEGVDVWEACRELALIEANWTGAGALKNGNTG